MQKGPFPYGIGPFKFFGAPDTIRTCDFYLRRVALYPAELRALGSNNTANAIGTCRYLRQRSIPATSIYRRTIPTKKLGEAGFYL